VLDADGHIIAQRKMDGAMFHMPEMAFNKAFTAVSFRRRAEEGASSPFFSRGPVVGGGRVATLLGGVPIRDGDDVIGAFGVAGGTDPQNSACMDAALAAV
jgi:glc operon protein GlcG